MRRFFRFPPVSFKSLNLSDTAVPLGVIGDVAQHRDGLQGDLKLQSSALHLQLLHRVKGMIDLSDRKTPLQ